MGNLSHNYAHLGAPEPVSSPKKRAVLAMGFREDNWRSSIITIENIAGGFQQSGISHDLRAAEIIIPELHRQPNWIDRRIRYSAHLPSGDFLLLTDQSYGDAVLPAKKKFSKVAILVHDLAFWHKRQILNYLFRLRIKKGIQSANAVIAISRHTASELERYMNVKAQGIIYPGSAEDKFVHTDQPRKPYQLLHVGTADERKGLDRVFRLLALLPRPFHLVQVGGSFSAEQLRMIDEMNLRDRVKQINNVSFPDLIGFYQTSQALLFPSRYEGFGLPLIEARLCGTAVITDVQVPAYEVLGSDPGTLALDCRDLDQESSVASREAFAQRVSAFSLQPLALANRKYYSWNRVAQEIDTFCQRLNLI